MFDNRRLERKVDALNHKLDLIIGHLGINPREQPAVPGMAEVDELINQGKKIQAIKVYRDLTGATLADAKAAVERRMR